MTLSMLSTLFRITFLAIGAMWVLAPTANAGPFTCDGEIYQVQSGQLRIFDPLVSAYVDVGSNQGSYNATGFNTQDNFAYGSQGQNIIRIHSDGSTEVVQTPGFSSYAGDVDYNNTLWLRRTSTRFIGVNLTTGSQTILDITGTYGNAADFAYFEDAGGQGYFVAPSPGRISVVNAKTGFSVRKTVPGLPTSGGFGATWTDFNGRVFTFHNSTGQIFEIFDIFTASPSATLAAQGDPSGNNDGFSCPLAPFPNLPPIARDDDYVTPLDTPVNSNVLNDNGNGADDDPEAGPLTVNTTPIAPPSNGSAVLNADGTFTYTPNPGFFGTDMFEYQIFDQTGLPATAIVTIVIEKPELMITKVASPTTGLVAGDTVTYTYTVQNTGNVRINGVGVSDVHNGSGSLSAISPSSVNMNAGDTQNFTATYVVTQADVDAGLDITNDATATGNPVTGTLVDPTDNAAVSVDATPSLSMTKTATNVNFTNAGDITDYEYVVTNDGTTTITTPVTLTDNLIPSSAISCPPWPAAGLAPGDTYTCTAPYAVTQADLDSGSVTNIASASDGSTTSPVDSETIPATALPALSMTKTALDTSFATLGQTVTYEYEIENTGNLTITGTTTITDDKIGTFNCYVGNLAPNDTQTCQANYTVTQADLDAGSVTNQAYAENGSLVSPPDDVTINSTATPSVIIDKPAPSNADGDGSSSVTLGDVLTYTVTATNNGPITLTGVTVSDSMISPSSNTCASVAPNATCVLTGTYTVTQADVDAGSIMNSATANSNETGPATDDETTSVAQTDSLVIDKPAPTNADGDGSGDVSLGDMLNYTITVTNDGTTTQTSVTVSDPMISPSSTTCASVAPGGICTLTGSYTVTQADVDAGSISNTASVTSDDITTPVTDDETTTVAQTDSLAIDKPAPSNADNDGSGDLSVGDVLTYTITATNDGTTTQSNVTVSDPLIAPNSATCASVAPGDTCVLVGNYTVTQTDVDSGSIDNTASVVSDDIPTPLTDDDVATFNQMPALDIVKNALDANFTAVNDILDYEYIVTNSGNITITAPITVSDNLIPSVACPTLPAGGLAPLASITCTASYAVTQADVDAGSVTNTASASDGTITSPTDDATVNGTQSPGWTLVKDVISIDYAAPNDVVSYEYTVTNTGNVTIDNIVVTDDKIASVNCPATTLAPGEDMVCLADYTVTQTDIDAGSVTNNADADGDSPSGPMPTAEDDATISANQTPALDIVKTANEPDFDAVGDVLTYDYVVTNSGNTTITSPITVTDNLIPAGDISCPALPAGGLSPTASITCTANYTINQSDLDAGSVTNTASTSDGSTTSPTDDATVSAVQSRALGIEKTANETNFDTAGDVLTYDYIVTNTGNVTITAPITVTDNLIPTVVCPALPAGGLAPLATLTCTASYTVTQADVDAGTVTNTASASDGTTTSPTDDATVSGDQDPELTVTKTADATGVANPAQPGDPIVYTILVQNTGNQSLTAVTVTDPTLGGDVTANCAFPGTAGSLGVNETATCTVTYALTQADIDLGYVENSATGTAEDPSGGPVTDTSDAGNESGETPDGSGNSDGDPTNDPTVTPLGQSKDFEVEKTATNFDFVAPGDIANYDYVVTNTGNVTLIDPISINDNLIPSSAITCSALPAGGLLPGDTLTCTASYTVTQADLDVGSVTNIASATDGTTTSSVDDATIPADQNPSLSIAKSSVDTSYAAVGDVLTYTYVVQNTGNLTLTGDTNVTDDKIGTFVCFNGNIAPGDTVTCTAIYTVTLADLDAGDLTNQAYAENGPLVSSPVDLTLPADQDPSITLDKVALNGAFDTAGDVISYEYIVENTGNVTISNLSVTDNLIAVVACPVSSLAPGVSTMCTASYTVTQADVDTGSVTNDATADGTPAGGTLNPADDSETVTADQAPSLSFDKVAQNSSYSAVGEVLSYQYVVENTGNVTINNIVVTDDQIASVSCPMTTLLPGQSMVCTGTDTVQQADLDAGALTNNASVDGDPAGGTLDPETDSETVPADQLPALEVVKTANETSVSVAGDVITYDYVVTNTGNTTLTQPVTVSDNLIPSVSCPALPAGGLVPVASLTCTGSYTVTQADIDAGSVTNIATASSGGTTSPQTDETVPAVRTPSLEIVKTAQTTTVAAAGDIVLYDYVVTNDGNVTITSPITVTDNLIPTVSCPALPVGGLAPAASINCTGQYTITQADIDAGSVTNIASASDGTTTSPTDDATVTADQMPALEMVKTALNPVFALAGDLISYEYIVTNTGNTSIVSPITVTDNLIPAVTCPALPTGGLPPMASITCSGNYTVTQADVDAGSVTNIAFASDGTTTSPTVDETATADQMPSLNFVKTPVTVNFNVAGDISTFEYVVTNDGNTTITSPITVTDNLIPVVSCPALPAGGLAPDASITCTGDYVVTQADLDNGSVTNIASATDGTTMSPFDDATIPVNAAPAITIDKVAVSTDFSMPGDVLTYQYTVTNNGNLTMTGVTDITDDKIETFICYTGNIVPGASETCTASYTVTQADVDAGSVTNFAFASNSGLGISSSVDDATVDGSQAPALNIAKTALQTSFSQPGDVIDYQYVVTNSGNTTIVFPIAVNDNQIPSVACPALPAGGLAPNGSITCTASDTVTQADIDAGSLSNTATATDGVTTSDPATETVGADIMPSIDMTKTALVSEFAAVGDQISYEYVITNTGNTTLMSPVAVNDNRIATVNCPAVPVAGIAPGGQIICTATDTVTQADIDTGIVTNTATGTLGGATSDPVTETVDATQEPELTLVKVANVAALSNPVVAGDFISYTLTTTNTGNVTVTNINIVDALLGGNITSQCTFPAVAGALNVGQSANCVVPYALTQADIDAGGVQNTATASGTDPSGDPVSDTSDSGDEGTETPDIGGASDGDPSNDPTVVNFGPAPSLGIDKRVIETVYASVGDVLTYEYDVTNTGNVTITNAITVSDDRIPSVSCPALPGAGLAPAAVLTCTGTYTVDQDDIDAGSVTNIASATAGSGADAVTSPNDQVTVDAGLMPELVVNKTVSEPRQIGGPVFEADYTITLTNTGNTTLTDVQLEDDIAIALAPATLFGTPTATISGLSGTGSVNPNYDGANNIQLLTSGFSLPVGETATIVITFGVDITTGSPVGSNTAYGSSNEITTPVPSDDPTLTPGDGSDTNPTPFTIVDADGDGSPDTLEESNADRDGDGIPDSEDYDPTGYFYCEENGQILDGGLITVSGPAGSQTGLGTSNNISIVQDGSNGYFQFFVTAPGRYTLIPTYPQSGIPSTTRFPEGAPLDVTSLLPDNPAILGSGEFGSTGRLADHSAATNGPFYLTFDIEPGDPAVFMNNLPLRNCGTPDISLQKVAIAEPTRQPNGQMLVSYALTATNTGETELLDVQIEDDLASVYGPGTVEVSRVVIMNEPATFQKSPNQAYDGEQVTTLMEAFAAPDEIGRLMPGESATVELELLVTPNSSGEYVNNAMASAASAAAADPNLGPNGGQRVTGEGSADVLIEAISDPSQIRVTKTARPSIVQIGDTVRYEIVVTNESDSTMTDLRIVDNPPTGFAYVPGSASLQATSGATIGLDPIVLPGALTWTIDAAQPAPFNELAAGESLVLKLSMVGGPNTEFGELTNRAVVEDPFTGIRSTVATAVVEYLPEPTFDCTPVIGHVYDDLNHNGYQDDGEPGIPGVRLATVNGDLIRTDEHGRFHIACATIPNADRGSNYILKVDARTLPLGFKMTTENPRVVRATRGKFVKMNFGAAFSETLRIDVSDNDFERGRLTESARTDFTDAGNAPRVLVVYRAHENENLQQVRERMRTLRSTLANRYDDLTVEAAFYVENYHKDDDAYEHEFFAGLASIGPRIEGKLDNHRTDHIYEGEETTFTHNAIREMASRLPADATKTPAYIGAPEIEMTVDPLHIEKALHANTELVTTKDGGRALAVFAWWNYPAWVERAELRIFKDGDTVRGTPVMVEDISNGTALIPVTPEEDYRVVVRVYDKNGQFDETASRLVRVDNALEGISEDELDDHAPEHYGANSIAVSNIDVNGAAVRVFGRNVAGKTVSALGQTVMIDADGQFVIESILPTGEHLVDVRAGETRILRDIMVKEIDLFGVAILDLSVGEHLLKGEDDDDIFIEGRAAFYVRGRLSERVRITATADTGEAELENLFDNLDEKDARNLLRRLDPDRYYPTYGDDSVITEDAPTSGRFYARVERDDDYALWGNYRTGFNDTEYTRIERTLYGAKLHWDQNSHPTAFGDARSSLTAFAAEPGTRSARDELRGTGGSVYYLRHADLSIGSEILRIETRDVISGIVLQSSILFYGEDYDIDYIQGRIILNEPLSSTTSDDRLFSDGGLSGHEVYLVAEYEYTADFTDGDEVAYGLRGTRWFGDSLKLGATFTRDAQGGQTTDFAGLDATFQITGDSFLKAEIAGSDGSGFDTFRSIDGGFDYVQAPSLQAQDDPLAWLLEGSLDLNDLGFAHNGTLSAYYRHRNAGFAGYGQLTESDTNQYGLALEADLSKTTTLRGRLDQVEGGFGADRTLAEVTISSDVSERLNAEAGLSYQDDRQFDQSVAVGIRGTKQIDETKSIYAFGQVGIEGDGNASRTDRIGVGAEAAVSDRLTLNGEVSTGAGGIGAQVGIRHQRDENTETYLTYDLPTRANVGDHAGGFAQSEGGLTLGARRRYSDSVAIYGEERAHFGAGENGRSGLTHAYGVDYQPNENWSFGAQTEIGKIDDFDRKALSVTGGYQKDDLRIGSEVEYRTDKNLLDGEDLEALLFRLTTQYEVNDALDIQGKLNHANTAGSGGDSNVISFNQANFTEASAAFAYRPIHDDRTNIIGKLVYLSDTAPVDQRLNGNRIDYKQRSFIVSLDGTYDMTDRCAIGGKVGHRSGEVTDGRDEDDFFESHATLYVVRADCHIVGKWDMMVEGRSIDLGDAPGRDGGLVGVFRQVGDRVRIGGGFAFGGIDDNYLVLEKDDNGGLFFNIVGKF